MYICTVYYIVYPWNFKKCNIYTFIYTCITSQYIYLCIRHRFICIWECKMSNKQHNANCKCWFVFFLQPTLGISDGWLRHQKWMQDFDVSICLRFSSTNTPSCVNQKLQEHMFLSIKQSSEMMELSSDLVSNNYFVTTFGHRTSINISPEENPENRSFLMTQNNSLGWNLTSFHLRLQEGRIVCILGIQCIGCENPGGIFVDPMVGSTVIRKFTGKIWVYTNT